MLSNLHGKMSEFFTWVYDYMMGYQYLNETLGLTEGTVLVDRLLEQS
jgi:hypothetical protein